MGRSVLDDLNIATRDYIMGVDLSRDEAKRQAAIDELKAAGYSVADATAAVDVAAALDPPPPLSPRAASLIDNIFQRNPVFAKLHGKSTSLPGGTAVKSSTVFGKPRKR